MRLAKGFYEAYWQRGEDIGKREVVQGVLRSVLGEEEAGRLEKAAGEEEAKRGVEGNTKMAVEGGCFGLPWFVVERGGEREVFWGFERLSEVVRVAGGVWEEGEEAVKKRVEEGPRSPKGPSKL